MKKLISILLISASLLTVGCGKEKVESGDIGAEVVTSSEQSTGENIPGEYTLEFGELISKTITGDTLIIKAKIEPSINNEKTVSQNGFNVEDLIHNQGADKFEEIQYWAVADMNDGSEEKVVSFTLTKEQIDNVKNKTIVGNKLVDSSTDVWIHPSLK